MFDFFIMIDWSSSAAAENQGADSIWIGYGALQGDIMLSNPPNRQAALAEVRTRLLGAVRNRQRILVGFDFAYGYPRGLVPAIGLRVAEPGTAWREMWELLHELAFNGVGGGDNNSCLDKFAVANELNRRFGILNPGLPLGPFWGRPDWTLSNRLLEQLPPEIPRRTVVRGGFQGRSRCGEDAQSVDNSALTRPTTRSCLRSLPDSRLAHYRTSG